ncbi:MAG: hypothetical protein QOF56_1096 [Acidobacteriaceae bacterium]|jgi:hypothetical protein|nr:hypothetical protein [Acidobacteriaceae bacterium]
MTQRTSNTATVVHRAIQDDDMEVIFLVAHLLCRNLTDELRIGNLSRIDHVSITKRAIVAYGLGVENAHP